MNTWSKGRQGDWLVKGPTGQAGTVEVSKRDGSTTTAQLAREVWSGDGVALYAVAPRERSSRSYSGRYRRSYGSVRGRCEDAPCCGCCE